jgi:uncharacterized integral membrane protein
MIISLILGVILGAALVAFVLQNVAIVTVTFISWQVTGSLALVLLASIISGVVVTLLILLPSLIKNDFYLAALKKQKKEVEDELARTKQEMLHSQAAATRTNTVTIEKTTTAN